MVTEHIFWAFWRGNFNFSFFKPTDRIADMQFINTMTQVLMVLIKKDLELFGNRKQKESISK